MHDISSGDNGGGEWEKVASHSQKELLSSYLPEAVAMGVPSTQASNAIIYLTYGAFL